MHYFSLDRQLKYIIETTKPVDDESMWNKGSMDRENERMQKMKSEFDKSCSVYPNSADCKQYNVSSLRKAMDDMEMTDPYARAALIGNVQKESGDFKWINESQFRSDEETKKYTARNYGMGNPKKEKELGNRPGTEDYFNFRGFGPIQITGRANWEKYAKKANLLKPNETIDQFEARVRGKTAKDSDVEAAFKMSIAYIQDRFPSQMNKLAKDMDKNKANIQFTNEAMIRSINPGLYSYAKPQYRTDIQTRIDYANAALKQELARPPIQLQYMKEKKTGTTRSLSLEAGGWVNQEVADELFDAEESKPAKKQASTINIKTGDTLSKIAKEQGFTLEQLKAANPEIKDPNKIKVGQKLNLPSK